MSHVLQTGSPGFNYTHQRLKVSSSILSGNHREKWFIVPLFSNLVPTLYGIEAAGVNRSQQFVVLIKQLAFAENITG